MSPEATKRIKYRYLLEEIANAEKIDFTEEEVNKMNIVYFMKHIFIVHRCSTF